MKLLILFFAETTPMVFTLHYQSLNINLKRNILKNAMQSRQWRSQATHDQLNIFLFDRILHLMVKGVSGIKLKGAMRSLFSSTITHSLLCSCTIKIYH